MWGCACAHACAWVGVGVQSTEEPAARGPQAGLDPLPRLTGAWGAQSWLSSRTREVALKEQGWAFTACLSRSRRSTQAGKGASQPKLSPWQVGLAMR